MKEIPFRKPRRRDRAVEDAAWIRELLGRAPVGVLATVSSGGGPTATPNLFVFDPARDAIYLHSAKTGETRSNVEARPRVAFCVVEMGRLLPADAAVNFSVEYASVVVDGESTVVEDPDESARALRLLMRKYAPQFQPEHDYRDVGARDLARTSVYRIDVESWSAKAKSMPDAEGYAYQPAEEEAAETRLGFFEALQAGFHSAFWATPPERSRRRA